jgi:hypothetical protein
MVTGEPSQSGLLAYLLASVEMPKGGLENRQVSGSLGALDLLIHKGPERLLAPPDRAKFYRALG